MYELVNELEFLFSEMNYSLIRQKIESIDKSLPEYNCLLSKQIIGWYTYMAHFNLRINDYSSLKLKELFEYTTNLPLEFVEGEHYSKYEIRIIYSYALYCCSIGDAHVSKRIISKLISYINEYCYDRDLLILTRLYHKYAHMLMDNQRFKEALEMINLGQGLIVNKSNLLLLSDFIYSKGTCYEHMGFDKKSLKLYARALSLRNTIGNETYT